jgi:hypothetical protein
MTTILNEKISFWKKYTFKKEFEMGTTDINTSELSKLKFSFITQSSTHFKDLRKYELFRYHFEVISGGWYGTEGRWKTLKKIEREIMFKKVKRLVKAGIPTSSFYEIYKPSFSNSCKVIISIAGQNTYTFYCSDILFTDYYKLFLFDIIIDEFVDMTDSFDGMTFIGEDLFEPAPF